MTDVNEAIESVWMWAKTHAGDTSDKPVPKFVLNSGILSMAANGRPRALAAYIKSANCVVLKTCFDAESVDDCSVLAHEFTHALGGGEPEAYAAQAAYYDEHKEP